MQRTVSWTAPLDACIGGDALCLQTRSSASEFRAGRDRAVTVKRQPFHVSARELFCTQRIEPAASPARGVASRSARGEQLCAAFPANVSSPTPTARRFL